ncbi:carbohydrate kinase family protein [Pseudogemmobacter sonorensis]|uniref:carbohydrate kinase family protein n=1 Tax=Pseudogemmobacter sonorensis TaxID=2989681 RepID=UPI0036B5EE59
MILCAGEALIDMLPRVSDAGERCFAPLPGGAVFNTAVALGRLGLPVGLFAGVSTDLMGEILAERLAASGVETRYLARSSRPTTLAFVELRDGQPRYAFYDEGSAGRMLAAADLPDLPPADPSGGTDALFFGGISLVGAPGAETFKALFLHESDRRVVMVDPNIRPGFIGAEEARYRARIARMIAGADIVKLSDEDLAWLEGPGAPVDLGRAILARGPALVLVTEGARGATAITRHHARRIEAHPTRIADTVGAGDTFNAGVLAALCREGALRKPLLRDPPPELLDRCLALGVRAAAVTVSRPGADPPWAHEL